MTATDQNTGASNTLDPARPAQKKDFFTALSELGEYFTHVFITAIKFLGLCFMYLIAIIYRGFTYIREPLGKFFKNISDSFTGLFSRRRKARKLGASEIARARKEKGAWGAFCAWLKITGNTVFGKRGLLATAVNWGLPIISCVFLFNIISYANSQNYALKLTVNGDFVGYINDENTFTEAEKIVQNRINYTGSSTEIISFDPIYEVESIGNGTLLNQYQIADKMLALLGKEVKEGFGLYLGNSYYGTLISHEELDLAMKDLLNKYSTGEDKEVIQFDKQINYISGTYLADSFVDESDIIRQFTSNKKSATYYTVKDGDNMEAVLENTGMTVEELASLNPGFNSDHSFSAGEKLKTSPDEPFLTVIVTREEHYTESFDFETQFVDDETVYAGNKVKQVDGENGERAVVANVSYINGKEVNRRILSRTVTKESVTEVIAVGTKPRNNTTAPGQTIDVGNMLWPVGGIDGGIITELVWWHGGYGGHKGIDIVAPHGTPIYAAENGVVITAIDNGGGWNNGRGNHVIIQDDSGYKTYYYHASEVVAYPGQRVTAGDLIAYVGQTGDATANHLHFGITLGDTWLNPTDYLPWHARSADMAAREY